MKLCEAKAGGKSIREIPKGLPIGKSKAVRGIIAACAFHSPPLSLQRPCPKFLYPNLQSTYYHALYFQKFPIEGSLSSEKILVFFNQYV